tara:strand:+ start:357 stop:1703 length:1347 start_codon:yes stop_codon:yes gene_type:complete
LQKKENKMHMIDVMKKLSEIAENYDNEDIQAGIVAAGKTHSVVAKKTVQESAVKDMMQDVEEGMTKAEFAKKYPGMADQYDEIKQEIKDKMDESKDEKVEDATVEDAVEDAVEEVHEDVESDETELDRMLYLGGVMGSSSNNIMIKENSEVPVQEDRKDDMISWVEKYENYIGRNGDSLPEGYVQWAMNSGITTDAMEQDEVDVMIKKYGEDKFEDDPMSFIDEMPITKAYMQELEQITGTDDIEDNAEMIRMFVESATNEASVIETEVQEENMDDKIMFKGKQVDMNKLDYKMQDVSDGMFTVNAPVFYTDGSEVADEDMEALEGMTQFQDWVMTDYTNESVEEASVEEASVEVPVQELQDILQLAGFENYAEKIEEYANEPNEEYGDSEEQMVGLSGGLNGPKTHYPAAAGGDNPMNVKPLKVDDVYESFYTKYDKFIAELNNQNK